MKVASCLLVSPVLVGLLPALPQVPTAADGDRDLTVFLAGDAILNRPWSQNREPEFVQLVAEIRRADVAMVNLETLIHTFQGFTVINTGGTPMHSDPAIARELAWAGFDMLCGSNNHTNDYGVIGLLETLHHVEQAGMKIAGVGTDLERATAPAYFETPEGTVALIATSSSIQEQAIASRSTEAVPGRPGLNPMRTRGGAVRTVTRSTADKLHRLAREEGLPETAAGSELRFYGQTYRIGSANEVRSQRGLHRDDLARNLAAVREARGHADLVVVTIHAHGSNGLEEFAHQCVDAGADMLFGHGPHVIRGIEIYKGKPLFYSLGDFAFQSESVKPFPAYYKTRAGFDPSATGADIMRRTRAGANRNRNNWESFAARVTFRGRELREVRLIPINCGLVPGDLGERGRFEVLPFSIRGYPFLADPSLGKYMIEQVARKSEEYDTRIEYVEGDNIGLVRLAATEGDR